MQPESARSYGGLGLGAIGAFLAILSLAMVGLIEIGAPTRARERPRSIANVSPAPTPTATRVPTAVPPSPTVAVQVTQSIIPTTTPTATPLAWISSSLQYRPVAVMIDNHPDARPHSGLTEADVVYEAVVEAGITRFMAIFGRTDAKVVGPVRSARHYFIYWASEYGAIYLHAGSSPQGYDAARSIALPRLDFTYGEGVYWRINNRSAPHNLYTDTGRSRQLAADGNHGSLGPVAYKSDAPAPTLSAITITHPDGYRVSYEYRSSDNSFLRQMARRPHIDVLDGVQYHPKNVVVQFVRAWRIPGDDAGRMDMELVGAGPAYFFRDGIATEGSWIKEGLTAATRFLDGEGAPVLLNVGQTWIQVVPQNSAVSYQ
ncbi:MAG: DUF3048 domain-containing protein [Chloroflexi bacterium]|nr:DUF3048 domain-containing protein [Chloroflexota bacterium]